jgi:lipopolysaccharide export system permease protein
VNRLDRYVWKELFVPFLIGTIAVVLMFQANYLIYFYKTFSFSAVPIHAVLKLVLFETPGYLNMTLPVGTSLGASLAISRLTRENELTAMRSAGASIIRVLRPLVLFGVLVAIGNFLVAERLMPVSKKSSRDLTNEISLLGGLVPEFKSNVTLNLRNQIAIIGTISRSNNTVQLTEIILFERPTQDELVLTYAEKGYYQDGLWKIQQPKTWVFTGDQLATIKSFKEGGELVIDQKFSIESMFSPPNADELPLDELAKTIRELKSQGIDTRSQEVLYHTRFSVPAACIIFALVSPIFCVYFARSGAFMGVLLSFIVLLLYYNAFIISTSILGPNGFVAPWIAAWLPNLVFMAIGFFGLRRLE